MIGGGWSLICLDLRIRRGLKAITGYVNLLQMECRSVNIESLRIYVRIVYIGYIISPTDYQCLFEVTSD
jgi:hypothetical protein